MFTQCLRRDPVGRHLDLRRQRGKFVGRHQPHVQRGAVARSRAAAPRASREHPAGRARREHGRCQVVDQTTYVGERGAGVAPQGPQQLARRAGSSSRKLAPASAARAMPVSVGPSPSCRSRRRRRRSSSRATRSRLCDCCSSAERPRPGWPRPAESRRAGASTGLLRSGAARRGADRSRARRSSSPAYSSGRRVVRDGRDDRPRSPRSVRVADRHVREPQGGAQSLRPLRPGHARHRQRGLPRADPPRGQGRVGRRTSSGRPRAAGGGAGARGRRPPAPSRRPNGRTPGTRSCRAGQRLRRTPMSAATESSSHASARETTSRMSSS